MCGFGGFGGGLGGSSPISHIMIDNKMIMIINAVRIIDFTPHFSFSKIKRVLNVFYSACLLDVLGKVVSDTSGFTEKVVKKVWLPFSEA